MPSDVSTVPFWRADHPGPGRPLERLPTRVDFAVVGAGYTGLNAAREIAATGASVLVLDAGPVGAGASWVNGGHRQLRLKAKTSKIYDMFGPRWADDSGTARCRRSTWCPTWSPSTPSTARSCGVAPPNSLQRPRPPPLRGAGGVVPGQARLSVRRGRARPDQGVIDSPAIHSAVIHTVGAGLHPARYVDGLARVAEQAAPSWSSTPPFSRSPATPAGTRCFTERGKVDAGEVILATNGYTGDRPVKQLRRRVIRSAAHRGHRAAADRSGGNSSSRQPDDVDRPPLPQLLQADSRRPDPDGRTEPVDQPRRAGERRSSAPRWWRSSRNLPAHRSPTRGPAGWE